MTILPQRNVLSGVRIMDFTWFLAGPQATRILAAFGAETIKVERPYDYEATRRVPMNPQGKVGPNLSGSFNSLNADKLSVTLNLRHPRGLQIAYDLLAKTDIVVENFTPGVMESWGLGYADIKKARPDIIYVSMSGYGHTGRSRDFVCFGPTAQAVSGLTHLSGLPGREPAGWGFSYMDHVTGYHGAMAVLQALHYRRRTGKGQWIDLTMIEGSVAMTGTSILEYTVNGRRSRRPGMPPGNRSVHPRVAPHNSYRCAGADAQGQDEWVAIACLTEDQWRALCGVMGLPDLAGDPRFLTNLDRCENEERLDALIGAWTKDKDKLRVCDALQRAGVPAGAVQNAQDRVERDPQLRARGMFVELEHAELGRNLMETLPMRLSETPYDFQRFGPLWGEHNEHVYGTVLGMGGEEIKKLREEGVI